MRVLPHATLCCAGGLLPGAHRLCDASRLVVGWTHGGHGCVRSAARSCQWRARELHPPTPLSHPVRTPCPHTLCAQLSFCAQAARACRLVKRGGVPVAAGGGGTHRPPQLGACWRATAGGPGGAAAAWWRGRLAVGAGLVPSTAAAATRSVLPVPERRRVPTVRDGGSLVDPYALQGHPEEVYACLFLPPTSSSSDGGSASSSGGATPQRLVTASGESLFLWDVATQRQLQQVAPAPPPQAAAGEEYQGGRRRSVLPPALPDAAARRALMAAAALVTCVRSLHNCSETHRPRMCPPPPPPYCSARALAGRLPFRIGGAAGRPVAGRCLQRRPPAVVVEGRRRRQPVAALHAALEPGGPGRGVGGSEAAAGVAAAGMQSDVCGRHLQRSSLPPTTQTALTSHPPWPAQPAAAVCLHNPRARVICRAGHGRRLLLRPGRPVLRRLKRRVGRHDGGWWMGTAS